MLIFCIRLQTVKWILGLGLLISLPAAADNFEPRLIDSLNAIQFQPENISESKLEALIEDYPNSQTAHLMMADLLAARAGVIDPYSLRERYQDPTALQQLDGLRTEMRLRWNQTTVAGPARRGLVPASVIRLAPNRKTVVVVDAPNARLYTYKNVAGKLKLAMSNYTSIGEKGMYKRIEGDEKTPIGVYYVTRYIDDSELPPLYGAGAFPINYPNALDRHYGRTGHGIWLHGTHPESFNRVPWASNGCVAMSNPEFDLLKLFVEPRDRTPVIVSDQLDWVKPEHLNITQQFFVQLLQNWVNDWESLDVEKYLSHYDGAAFFSKDDDYASWAEQKRAVNSEKSEIEVELSNISLFAYPGEEDMIVAEFTQDYYSNNFSSEEEKRLYWKRNAQGDWKITHEGLQ